MSGPPIKGSLGPYLLTNPPDHGESEDIKRQGGGTRGVGRVPMRSNPARRFCFRAELAISRPALLVRVRRTREHLGNSYTRLSSCDEHRAAIQSRCRVKEAPGSHGSRRRELVGRRIEYFRT
jgi:hypothetical protein